MSENVIKVSAITSGKYSPSSRFRIRQHIEPLKVLGLDVYDYATLFDVSAPIPFWPEKLKVGYYALPVWIPWQGIKLSMRIPGILASRKGHITWLCRSLLPGYLTFEPLLKKPLVLDVDDAIWLCGRFAKKPAIAAAKRSDVIIAGNNYLAAWFEPYCSHIHVIPTSIDTERFMTVPDRVKHKNERFVIGWTGLSSNLRYVEMIEDCLRKFLKDYPLSKLLIVSDKPPGFKTIPADQLQYIPWSEDTEVSAIHKMDVGIMPLPDNEWTRGKCSFKMLQYMACGIPVIVSPVGMNIEVLSKGGSGLAPVNTSDWYDAFSFFYQNRTAAKCYGSVGRSVVEEHYSRKLVSAKLAAIFKGLV